MMTDDTVEDRQGDYSPLPPGTSLRIGYHPDSKDVLLIFEHPNSSRSLFMPISMESALRMSEMLQSVVKILSPRKLDS